MKAHFYIGKEKIESIEYHVVNGMEAATKLNKLHKLSEINEEAADSIIYHMLNDYESGEELKVVYPAGVYQTGKELTVEIEAAPAELKYLELQKSEFDTDI